MADRDGGQGNRDEIQFVQLAVLIIAGGIKDAVRGVGVEVFLKFLANDGDVPTHFIRVDSLKLRPRAPRSRRFIPIVDGSWVCPEIVGSIVPDYHHVPPQTR